MTDQQHFTAGAIEAAQMGLHKIKQNEMKANELRIGNWVKHNDLTSGSEYPNTEFQIELDHFHDLATSSLLIGSLDPIPLDESWLIRAGFIYHNPSDFYSKNWGRNGAEIVKKYPDGWMFELGKGYLRHFEYVHQLQNLFFALTGTELEIKDVPNP